MTRYIIEVVIAINVIFLCGFVLGLVWCMW